MSAIRNGQFKLKSAQQPAQQAAQKPADTRQALFSAIKNREFNLKTVSPAAGGKPGRTHLCCLTWSVADLHNTSWVPSAHLSLGCTRRSNFIFSFSGLRPLAQDHKVCCSMATVVRVMHDCLVMSTWRAILAPCPCCVRHMESKQAQHQS